MIKIPVKKLKITEIEVLQFELECYVSFLSLHCIKKDFLNAITSLDIANNLYYILRTKIENRKTECNINFTVSQAATIVKCCYYNRHERSDYTKNVMLQLNLTLDKQLKSLV